MLPNKPAKDYCAPSIGYEDVIEYNRNGAIRLVCCRCRWVIESHGTDDRYETFLTRFRHLYPLPQEVVVGNELTTRPDFIEIKSKRTEGSYNRYETQIINRNYIISFSTMHNLLKIDEKEQIQERLVHPDSVEDLLNFIKEG